jgi:selenocysteine-specific elongation factor
MYTIGTAGHIDHGKTTLCRLLTGIDTDRLSEEKQRGISIDLGFAHFTTPAGKPVGVVDVPGHERFVRNMVAGVAGIDAFLFTIAADEGIMPQTREHLDILELLGVTRGIIVLTKCDMVDAEWQQLVTDEVKAALDKTPFATCPIVPVSQDDPASIAALSARIDAILGEPRTADEQSLFRMPIDRVFSLKGYGTVVTGTVASGRLKVGEQVEILPSGGRSRVRSIQSFNKPTPSVSVGQRAALNVPDLDTEAMTRGDAVLTPGVFVPSSMVDGRLKLLRAAPGSSSNLKHLARIRFYSGTAEVIGRISLLESPTMDPGTEQLVQFRLESPVVVSRGDRFLVRSFSPLLTIGGGTVVDPHPSKHRRSAHVVETLERMEESGPGALLVDALERGDSPLATAADLAKAQAWRVETVEEALNGLAPAVHSVERRRKRVYFLRERVARDGARIRTLVERYHMDNPLQMGVDRAALQASYNPRLDADTWTDLLSLVLEDQGLVADGALVRLATFTPVLDVETEVQCGNVVKRLLDEGVTSITDLALGTGLKRVAFDKVVGYLLSQKTVLKLPDNLLAHQRTVAGYERKLVELFAGKEKLATGDIKDCLNLTRKVLIPLLEFFDEVGLTVRVGNDRKLRAKPTPKS